MSVKIFTKARGLVSWSEMAMEILSVITRVKNGIMLTPISNRYRDKPLRWDWACANGKWNDALLKYPKFKTYLFR